MDVDEQLIEEVRGRPILYDLGQENYKNIKQKDIVWREVADAVKISEMECKRRWKGLRDTYKRCKRSMEVASGSGAEGPKKRWRHFEAMSFLDNVACSRRTIGNVRSCSQTEDDIIEVTDESSDDFVSPISRSSTALKEKKKTDSDKFQQFLDFASSSISETCSVFSKKKEEDSTSLFFAGLAAKIKAANMPPSVVNKIEAKLSAMVCEEINSFYSQQQQQQ